MQRVRRLALVAVLTLVGGLALAGCRSEPGIAAYVGDKSYSVVQVDALAGEVQAASLTKGQIRQFVLGSLVVRDVGQRLSAEQGFTIPPGDVAAAATSLHLPATSALARLLVDTNGVLDALSQRATPVDPTEAQQRELYASLTYQGQSLSQRIPFAQVRGLLTKDQIGRGLAVRDVLNQEIGKSHVTINPRYAGLSYLLQVSVADGQGAVANAVAAVPLGDPSVIRSHA